MLINEDIKNTGFVKLETKVCKVCVSQYGLHLSTLVYLTLTRRLLKVIFVLELLNPKIPTYIKILSFKTFHDQNTAT
jgi:hypothetical protein